MSLSLARAADAAAREYLAPPIVGASLADEVARVCDAARFAIGGRWSPDSDDDESYADALAACPELPVALATAVGRAVSAAAGSHAWTFRASLGIPSQEECERAAMIALAAGITGSFDDLGVPDADSRGVRGLASAIVALAEHGPAAALEVVVALAAHVDADGDGVGGFYTDRAIEALRLAALVE